MYITQIEINLRNVITDFNALLASNTKTEDKLDCTLSDLPKRYDFFVPWAGMEKAQHQDKNPDNIKTAENMAKFFDVTEEELLALRLAGQVYELVKDENVAKAAMNIVEKKL